MDFHFWIFFRYKMNTINVNQSFDLLTYIGILELLLRIGDHKTNTYVQIVEYIYNPILYNYIFNHDFLFTFIL